MTERVSEFNVAEVLVACETGRGVPDELMDAAFVAADRGLIVKGWCLTSAGTERLSGLRALFATKEEGS